MLDAMRMRTACFARAPQRCTSRLSRHFLLTFQEVRPLSKTRNQLILWCRRCGRRLAPSYSGKANHLRYMCMRATIDYGTPGCLSLSGAFLDDFVVAQLMAVLQPASLELSIAAEHMP